MPSSTLQMALPLSNVDRLQRRTFFSGLVRVPSGKYKFIAIRNWIFLRLIFSHFPHGENHAAGTKVAKR